MRWWSPREQLCRAPVNLKEKLEEQGLMWMNDQQGNMDYEYSSAAHEILNYSQTVTILGILGSRILE